MIRVGASSGVVASGVKAIEHAEVAHGEEEQLPQCGLRQCRRQRYHLRKERWESAT